MIRALTFAAGGAGLGYAYGIEGDRLAWIIGGLMAFAAGLILDEWRAMQARQAERLGRVLGRAIGENNKRGRLTP